MNLHKIKNLIAILTIIALIVFFTQFSIGAFVFMFMGLGSWLTLDIIEHTNWR